MSNVITQVFITRQSQATRKVEMLIDDIPYIVWLHRYDNTRTGISTTVKRVSRGPRKIKYDVGFRTPKFAIAQNAALAAIKDACPL